MAFRSVSKQDAYSEFFVVRDPLEEKAIRLDFPDLSWDQAESLYRGAEAPATRPLRAVRDTGTRTDDLLWTSFVKPLVVNAKVVELLREFGAKGWKIEEVDVADVPIEGEYFWLAIAGRAGPVNDDLVSVVMKRYPTGEFPVSRGLFFDLDTWDGSDIFITSDDEGWLIVTRALAERFREKDIGNIEIVPVTEYERVVT
jgi:hypothetical protein